MPDPCHCKHCGRYVPEADPESDAVVCCYCAMGRAASPEVEKETKRQEIEWLHAQKSRAATSRARRVSRELRVMEKIES